MKDVYILAVESSCDDTSAAVLRNQCVLSNVLTSQKIHEQYGGVVPELASRAHQANIVPVVNQALDQAGIDLSKIDAVAFTAFPGLLGSLLVGSSFVKGLALSLNKPVLAIDHMQAHMMALFIDEEHTQPKKPSFPFICLTVSGGHTQISIVRDFTQIQIIGKTKDDAVGEAFDKIAKLLGLPYPGGPLIDQIAREGNPLAFHFSESNMENLDFSFSGIKTSVLYFLEEKVKEDPDFIKKNLADICASAQYALVNMLLKKIKKASVTTGIREIAVVGGVSANSWLRSQLENMAQKSHWNTYFPKLQFCTDNAAMIGVSAYFKMKGQSDEINDMFVVPRSR